MKATQHILPRSRGRGTGEAGGGGRRKLDPREHPVESLRVQHIMDHYTQYADALFLEPAGSTLITLGRGSKVVRTSIHFDAEPRRRAVKIEDVVTDRMLTAEAEMREVSPAKVSPQHDFGWTHRSTQLARAFERYFQRSHLPPPPPSAVPLPRFAEEDK
jgi:hypothetical protein